MVRILQVITDTDRRGAQVFATDLGTAMTAFGHDVNTVALAPGEQRPALDVESLGRRQRGPATLRALRKRMASADVTIAHGSATGLACAVAGFPNLPFVYRQISDTRFWADTPMKRIRVGTYLRRSRRVVALSEGAKADLVDHLKLPADRITVVPNGVPVGSFRPASADERARARARLGVPDDRVVALYIGAMVPEKGADLAVDAVAGIEGMHLLMVGGGPATESLRDRAERVAPGRITFAGVLDDAAPAYAAADVVVLPSRGGDSMPATLIEAGFCGLPAVSTPIGSISDVVVHDRTGTVVRVGDLEAFRAALGALVADPGRRADLGRAAREHCLAHFEIDVVAAGWVDALDAVAGREATAMDRHGTGES